MEYRSTSEGESLNRSSQISSRRMGRIVCVAFWCNLSLEVDAAEVSLQTAATYGKKTTVYSQ